MTGRQSEVTRGLEEDSCICGAGAPVTGETAKAAKWLWGRAGVSRGELKRSRGGHWESS